MPNIFADMFLEVEYTFLYIVLSILIQISLACVLFLMTNSYNSGYFSIPFTLLLYFIYSFMFDFEYHSFIKIESHNTFILIGILVSIPILIAFIGGCKQRKLTDRKSKLVYILTMIGTGLASIYMIYVITNWR